MTGKTHMAIGVGATTMLLPTNDIKTIISGTALAIVGSLIVDIDTAKSEGAVFLKKIFGGSIIFLILGLILKVKYNVNVFNYITQNKEVIQMLPALIIFLVALVVGAISPHRSFTHSLIGLIAYSIPMYMMMGTLYKWFAIGYVAHILADMLNKKETKILFPLKKGICLNLCSSNGIVDKTLCVIFVGITVLKYKSYLNI